MSDAKNTEEKTAEKAPGTQPLNVDANQLIELLAKELQSVPAVKAPAWATFVKTGAHKERPPAKKDWWYFRAASVLRTVARLGPVGTAKLRTKYGGKHSRGFKSERFAPGSGSILRKSLQQLEKAGLVKQTVKGVHKGRIITEKAAKLMEATAAKVTIGARVVKMPKPIAQNAAAAAPQTRNAPAAKK